MRRSHLILRPHASSHVADSSSDSDIEEVSDEEEEAISPTPLLYLERKRKACALTTSQASTSEEDAKAVSEKEEEKEDEDDGIVEVEEEEEPSARGTTATPRKRGDADAAGGRDDDEEEEEEEEEEHSSNEEVNEESWPPKPATKRQRDSRPETLELLWRDRALQAEARLAETEAELAKWREIAQQLLERQAISSRAPMPCLPEQSAADNPVPSTRVRHRPPPTEKQLDRRRSRRKSIGLSKELQDKLEEKIIEVRGTARQLSQEKKQKIVTEFAREHGTPICKEQVTEVSRLMSNRQSQTRSRSSLQNAWQAVDKAMEQVRGLQRQLSEARAQVRHMEAQLDLLTQQLMTEMPRHPATAPSELDADAVEIRAKLSELEALDRKVEQQRELLQAAEAQRNAFEVTYRHHFDAIRSLLCQSECLKAYETDQQLRRVYATVDDLKRAVDSLDFAPRTKLDKMLKEWTDDLLERRQRGEDVASEALTPQRKAWRLAARDILLAHASARSPQNADSTPSNAGTRTLHVTEAQRNAEDQWWRQMTESLPRQMLMPAPFRLCRDTVGQHTGADLNKLEAYAMRSFSLFQAAVQENSYINSRTTRLVRVLQTGDFSTPPAKDLFAHCFDPLHDSGFHRLVEGRIPVGPHPVAELYRPLRNLYAHCKDYDLHSLIDVYLWIEDAWPLLHICLAKAELSLISEMFTAHQAAAVHPRHECSWARCVPVTLRRLRSELADRWLTDLLARHKPLYPRLHWEHIRA